jgi:hypothetical protein
MLYHALFHENNFAKVRFLLGIKIESLIVVRYSGQTGTKSAPDLTPERDQLNPDQSHVMIFRLPSFSGMAKFF